MSQPQAPKPKHPVDILQSMINAILIETGKALRVNNKESGRTVASANARLRTTIPAFTDNFHQALDDLECDIIRAKSVLSRDLEELRSRRIAFENPEPILEPEPIIQELVEVVMEKEIPVLDATSLPKVVVKGEESNPNTPKAVTDDLKLPVEPSQALPPSNAPQPPQMIKVKQDSTPPSSIPDEPTKSNPIGLGINTEGTTTISAPGTADLRNNSINSLFVDISDADHAETNYDDMDFTVHDSGTTQTADQSQTLGDEFDLSSFGNTQDLNRSEIQHSEENQGMTVTTESEKKLVDDLLIDSNTGNNMDIDLEFITGEGDGSLFDDDMFYGSGGAADLSGGGEMEHDFDDAFFGLT